MSHARAFSGSALIEDTIIMAVGGKWYQEHWYVDYLNVNGATWAESTSLPTARAYHSSVATRHHVFCIGGQSGEDILDDVIALTDSGWVALPSLLHERAGHSSVIIDTTVYVLGGYRQSDEQWVIEPTVEAFSVSAAIAESFEAEQIGPLLRFPNPMSPRHTIHLTSSSSARVRIYTSTGRLLRDFEVQESFRLSNVLSDDIRRSVVLFLRVSSGKEEQCFKCLLFP
jgi:hypothetical protein